MGNAVLEASRLAASGQPVMTQSAPAVTLGEQLRQLADLHSEGVLSDEEFAKGKASLLEQL